jgi:hypothetical protein
MPKLKKEAESESLKGWQQIAAFLGQPVSVAERWAHDGMPVERKGRNVYASREDLRSWLSRESAGEPVQIASEDIDLSSELKRGLAYVRTSSRRANRDVRLEPRQ